LDELSKFLVRESQKQVLVVNPYVNKCNLSECLVQASYGGKDVLVVTLPPSFQTGRNAERADEFHGILKGSGVKLVYNKSVHAKLMVVDRAVAIASSMNLGSGSTAGASWEAGIVSVEDTVVESVMDSIAKLVEKPESKTI
jgi:phosphatidylserine/phosphatidylglycerophosphate/cardiolipin synthase-like enzyme